MKLSVGDHRRTVDPRLSGVVLRATERPDSGARTVPIGEAEHRQNLEILAAQGWEPLEQAAHHLLDRPRETEIDAIVRAGDLATLITAVPALQMRYYAGHTTDFTITQRGVTVTHRPLLGHAPAVAESLFVAAIHRVMIQACVGSETDLRLIVNGARIPPRDFSTRCNPGHVDGWEILLPTDRLGPADHVYQAVLHDPARAWTVAELADRLHFSPRTLQRALRHAGTTARSLITRSRTDVARGLIERTSLTLSDIAAATGFSDHAHLTHRYRDRFGESPSHHRSALGVDSGGSLAR